MSVPSLALFNPSAAHSFLDLTKRMKVISYGDHHMQEIHLIEPNLENCGNYRGLLFFVVRHALLYMFFPLDYNIFLLTQS